MYLIMLSVNSCPFCSGRPECVNVQLAICQSINLQISSRTCWMTFQYFTDILSKAFFLLNACNVISYWLGAYTKWSLLISYCSGGHGVAIISIKLFFNDFYFSLLCSYCTVLLSHYSDIIMSVMASQIVCLTVYSGADQRKHHSSVSLAFVWGIHWWPVNFLHKGPVTRKMFPIDDIIMSWKLSYFNLYSSLMEFLEHFYGIYKCFQE